jgi:hypothetical protein
MDGDTSKVMDGAQAANLPNYQPGKELPISSRFIGCFYDRSDLGLAQVIIACDVQTNPRGGRFETDLASLRCSPFSLASSALSYQPLSWH